MTALESVDLSLHAGESVAVVGPSGAGKTTLLKLVNRLVTPSAGKILIDGEDLSGLPPKRLSAWRSQVGYIPQDFGLVPNVRVYHNVLSGRVGDEGIFQTIRNAILPPKRALMEAHAVLDRLGIEQHLFRRTDSLSGGEQQRVAIARALHQEPCALLADEPLASVDPARAKALLELLLEVVTEKNMTLLVSLHSVELATAHFQRIVGLRSGKVVFDKPAAEVDQGEIDSLYSIDARNDAH